MNKKNNEVLRSIIFVNTMYVPRYQRPSKRK